MSCRTPINGFTTNITSTSIATVTHSSIRLPNLTPCSFLSLGRRRRCSITNPNLVNRFFRPLELKPHSVVSGKKLQRRVKAYAGFLELPLLPFPSDQVLVPSEAKTLHLFEARYLKLLDECLLKRKKLFVHFVLDPIAVEQLDVGALVSIRGVGRVTLVKFAKADPFLKGIVLPLQDNVPQNESEVSSKVLELKEALEGLNSLEIKLKAAKDEPLRTQTANSLDWAVKQPSLDCEEVFIPSFAERVSFAAFQIVSGSTHSEMLKLQKEKLKAMDIKETLLRLETSLSFVKNNASMTAAKLAIQSLNMQ